MVRVFGLEDLPVAIEDGEFEIREPAEVGGMTIHFGRVPKISSVRVASLMKGFPGDMCPCAHWTYVIKGKARVRTKTSEGIVSAGQVCYSPPEHEWETLEDLEFMEVTPAGQFNKVLDHMREHMREEAAR